MARPALSVAELLDGADASDAGVARVFERVRDIPFTFATHSDADTLLACGAGTCAPKHALLARLYGQLGLETRFIYVAFRFDDMPGDFPRELRHGIHDGIVRAHAALRVRRPSGWVDVDATFDQLLTEARFIVTERWDGRSSMPLVVTPLSRVESALLPEHEERLLGISHRTSLPGSVVRELNAWLDTVRTDVGARRTKLSSR
jgi:transglutaminase-like putative cysteine protease